MDTPLILAINLGATSSKFGLFSGSEQIATANYPLDAEIAKLSNSKQRAARKEHLTRFLAEHDVQSLSLSAIAARGGLMKPLPTRGVYTVDPAMLEDLASERFGSHPANLSAIIASELGKSVEHKLPVYVVDPITIDTLCDEARVSGVPGITRTGRYHALNVHRAARAACRELGIPVNRATLVVAHFGSGVSICSMMYGRVIDVNDAQLGEGPFSVARAGTLPLRGVLDLAYNEADRSKLEQRLARESGLAAYLGTADFEEIERRLDKGDPSAYQAYEAMLFQSAKYIAAHAGSFGSRIHAVVLTGGLLKSKRFSQELRGRVGWIAPVFICPGEDELTALAEGAAEAITGVEPVLNYADAPSPLEAPPRSLYDVLNRSRKAATGRFVVAGGHHPEIAETIRISTQYGIHGFVLVGPESLIREQLETEGVDSQSLEIHDCAETEIVPRAIELVRKDDSSALVKGKCSTAALLKAVLDILPDGSAKPFLSHVAIIENPLTNRLIGICDGGLNVDPDLTKKIGIMQNAISTFQALGVKHPHVLLAAGMEDQGQDQPAIADAREIVKRHHEGEWPDAVIDGPFGIDIAYSKEAAVTKGIKTPVAGSADIVITPNLESCNFAMKLAIIYSNEPWAGLVVGGPFPVVLGSRADPAFNRVCALALAQLVAAGMAKQTRNAASEHTNG